MCNECIGKWKDWQKVQRGQSGHRWLIKWEVPEFKQVGPVLTGDRIKDVHVGIIEKV